jgi:hypothetical protein
VLLNIKKGLKRTAEITGNKQFYSLIGGYNYHIVFPTLIFFVALLHDDLFIHLLQWIHCLHYESFTNGRFNYNSRILCRHDSGGYIAEQEE